VRFGSGAPIGVLDLQVAAALRRIAMPCGCAAWKTKRSAASSSSNATHPARRIRCDLLFVATFALWRAAQRLVGRTGQTARRRQLRAYVPVDRIYFVIRRMHIISGMSMKFSDA
jgi:hypothetical protein